MAFLLSGDILRSLSLGILVSIVTGIGLNKYKNENNSLKIATENKINQKYVGNSEKIVNWKAVVIGLAVSGILLIILLFTPPPSGVTELSEEASNLLIFLIMGAVFLGGAVTGYISHSDESGLINSVIFTIIIGLLMALLSPLMVIFVILGPIGGIIGLMLSKFKK